PGTQDIYISDYERMMMDCEKLTIIQRFELETTASHANLVPMKFVERGILHIEANHYERNHFGENMPYNPKAVSVNVDTSTGNKSVSILSAASDIGIRERVLIRPEGRMFKQPSEFSNHIEFICDDIEHSLNPDGLPEQSLASSQVMFYQQQSTRSESMDVNSVLSAKGTADSQ
ncbi:unnamed protein product, partial [Allacma fusca]